MKVFVVGGRDPTWSYIKTKITGLGFVIAGPLALVVIGQTIEVNGLKLIAQREIQRDS